MDPRGAQVALAPPVRRRAPGGSPAASALGLGLLPLAFMAVLLVAPLLRLLAEGGSLALLPYWGDLWRDDYLRWRLLWSLLQAAVTCGLALAQSRE